MISVGTSNFLRSSVKSVSEKALMQSKVFLAPACIPWSQNESIMPSETLEPGRLAPKNGPLAILQGSRKRPILRGQPARLQSLTGHDRLVLAPRDAGRRQEYLRLHQSFLRDGFHRRPQEVRRADADHSRRRRPDRANRRGGSPLSQAGQECDPEDLQGRTPRSRVHAPGPAPVSYTHLTLPTKR